MSAKKSDEAIPLKVLEMAIVMVNAADQCDQAGQWDRDHRRACRHILDWYNSNDYKITCDKAGCGTRQAGHWKGWTTSKFTGKYIDVDEPEFKDYKYYTCSECYRKSAIRELYCPSCGARMEVSEDAGSD